MATDPVGNVFALVGGKVIGFPPASKREACSARGEIPTHATGSSLQTAQTGSKSLVLYDATFSTSTAPAQTITQSAPVSSPRGIYTDGLRLYVANGVGGALLGSIVSLHQPALSNMPTNNLSADATPLARVSSGASSVCIAGDYVYFMGEFDDVGAAAQQASSILFAVKRDGDPTIAAITRKVSQVVTTPPAASTSTASQTASALLPARTSCAYDGNGSLFIAAQGSLLAINAAGSMRDLRGREKVKVVLQDAGGVVAGLASLPSAAFKSRASVFGILVVATLLRACGFR